MRILQSRGFKSTIKKLHPNQKKDLDRAVRAIATNPLLGEAKIGDLEQLKLRLEKQKLEDIERFKSEYQR